MLGIFSRVLFHFPFPTLCHKAARPKKVSRIGVHRREYTFLITTRWPTNTDTTLHGAGCAPLAKIWRSFRYSSTNCSQVSTRAEDTRERARKTPEQRGNIFAIMKTSLPHSGTSKKKNTKFCTNYAITVDLANGLKNTDDGRMLA